MLFAGHNHYLPIKLLFVCAFSSFLPFVMEKDGKICLNVDKNDDPILQDLMQNQLQILKTQT